MIAVGCDRLSTLAQKRGDLVFLHYASHTPFGDNLTIGQKILVNPFRSIAFIAGFEEGPDLWK